MILYGSYTSPFVRHCRIELHAASLEYEMVDTDYAASAKGSPTKRVPYLEDGGLRLTDSSSILMHLKHKQGADFLASVAEMEHYQLAGTVLDTAINLFLLEREGQTPANNDYLERQAQRVESGLTALNDQHYSDAAPYTVAQIRTACLLDWGAYRGRFSIDGLENLQRLLSEIQQWAPFADTAPPPA